MPCGAAASSPPIDSARCRHEQQHDRRPMGGGHCRRCRRIFYRRLNLVLHRRHDGQRGVDGRLHRRHARPPQRPAPVRPAPVRSDTAVIVIRSDHSARLWQRCPDWQCLLDRKQRPERNQSYRRARRKGGWQLFRDNDLHLFLNLCAGIVHRPYCWHSSHLGIGNPDL